MSSTPVAIFDVALVGDYASGKSSFINRFIMDPKFVYPQSTWRTCNYHILSFETTRGEIHLRVCDSLGQERMGGLRDGFYINKQAAIIMFDVTNRSSFKNTSYWHRDIVRVCGETIPIVLCGNKVDLLKQRKVKSFYHVKYGPKLPYFEVSALANCNIEQPMLYLMRKLMNDDQLNLIKNIDTIPPSVTIDPEYFVILEKEWWKQKEMELFQVYEQNIIFFGRIERMILHHHCSPHYSDIDIISYPPSWDVP
ncbi:hypothetical protein C9374_003137 [Naegleria lovaniensis]|uniref:GTP-binding nuclear protein n=1 Tax=Naegleria lovaniensis TaxID=51637 RepID=A0AA88KKP8_NAELO|nr:uncharacterized protein C9374_003137 [Naegleria lovaniensis]KAG2385988.1 hypothetical protein C9374_003137 [Naegleria lovaniensis]